MPATLIDPDYGFVELDFTAGKAAGSPPDFVVDVYHAVETLEVVQKRYLKELEDAGRHAEAHRGELLRRWAGAVFGGNPGVDPARLSVAVLERALQVVFAELVRLKKNAPASGTPG